MAALLSPNAVGSPLSSFRSGSGGAGLVATTLVRPIMCSLSVPSKPPIKGFLWIDKRRGAFPCPASGTPTGIGWDTRQWKRVLPGRKRLEVFLDAVVVVVVIVVVVVVVTVLGTRG